PWCSAGCRCRARSTATKAGTSTAARRRQPTATARRCAWACCCRCPGRWPPPPPLYATACWPAITVRPGSARNWCSTTPAAAPAAADGYRPPLRVGVLLPLSGPLATAAAPVRDGLLAGYYGETRQRPELVFYDTGGSAAGTLAAYARATSEGSDFVVGPLGRDEVTALYHSDTLPVPSLALNRGNSLPPPGHAMFSLAPEDDGMAAADYLLARERRNVLVLAGTDENALRAVEAFRTRLGERGGTVAATLSVGEQPGDLS